MLSSLDGGRVRRRGLPISASMQEKKVPPSHGAEVNQRSSEVPNAEELVLNTSKHASPEANSE